MSEQSGAPATGATNTPPADPKAGEQSKAPEGVPAEAWDALGDKGKAALTSEREARSAAERAAAELQAKLDEIEKANLSEVERAKRETEETKAALEQAKTEALRFRLAAKYGISDEDAKFLVGDEETMTALAERLAAANASAPRDPAPDPTQGAPGNGAPKSLGEKFASAFEGRI